MAVSIIVGDALSKLKTLPSESVHCCISSPPYYGLRDYGVEGQIGLEPTPEAYVARMVKVFGEVRRVLRNDGTLWLNIGDSYNGSKTGNTEVHKNPRAATNSFQKKLAAMCKPKDLLGIPWMLAFALRADGWYLRRDIIWHKPNPMPESVTDRPTTAHEYLFLMTKSGRYFYDATAVAEPCLSGPSDVRKMIEGLDRIGGKHKSLTDPRARASSKTAMGQKRSVGNGATRNHRSVWTIATAPFRSAHFATFPPALIEPCILAGTSERGVCPQCEAPWERVLGERHQVKGRGAGNGFVREHRISVGGRGDETTWTPKARETIGWRPTCSCSAVAVPAKILDPFFGAGTTGLVAQQHGRDCIGIELNPEYAEMARRRIDNAANPNRAAA